MIGQVNVTATNILRDPNNSTLFWVSGFISSSDSLLATFRYANRQDSLNLIPNVPTGFIFQFNSSSLNVTRQAILLPNMTIDSFTIGTGTSFRSRIYFGGRLYRNTTLGTWPITKLGGIHDGVFAAITFNSTSFTTLSITQKYCTCTFSESHLALQNRTPSSFLSCSFSCGLCLRTIRYLGPGNIIISCAKTRCIRSSVSLRPNASRSPLSAWDARTTLL